jgi:hypothetical protein
MFSLSQYSSGSPAVARSIGAGAAGSGRGWMSELSALLVDHCLVVIVDFHRVPSSRIWSVFEDIVHEALVERVEKMVRPLV